MSQGHIIIYSHFFITIRNIPNPVNTNIHTNKVSRKHFLILKKKFKYTS